MESATPVYDGISMNTTAFVQFGALRRSSFVGGLAFNASTSSFELGSPYYLEIGTPRRARIRLNYSRVAEMIQSCSTRIA